MNINGFMNNPPYGPFDFDHLRSPLRASLEQGVKHRVETCMKVNSFLAGADSGILRIRESCRLVI